jgi:tight adherence protein C
MMDQGIAIFVVVCLGMALGTTVWGVVSLILAVPADDRAYLDRPPLGFRLVWPVIRILAWYLRAVIPAAWQVVLERRLQKAGLDFVLTPEQLLAGHGVGAIAGLLAGCGVAQLLEGPLVLPALLTGVFGGFYPAIWLSEQIDARRKDLLKTLPFYLDIITLCVEAGLNLNGALRQATLKGPPGVLRQEFKRILRDIRAGKPRAEALRAFAARVGEPSVTNLVSSIIQAEALGMSLGPLLRAQAEQRRTERFLRAEKLAMEAPVKMLLPLVAFIFPCTFVVLGFPIFMMFKDM